MKYKVRIDVFEGPFDLLVYLIEHSQMSIYDIHISEITAQYLEYLEEMQELNIIIAGEFMVLAAELLEIKSKMIIPREEADSEGEPVEDPRDSLTEKLLEYKRYKELAGMLESRMYKYGRIYSKPKEDISKYTDNPEEYLSLSEEQFTSAFKAFLYKKKKVEDIRKRYVRIERERASTESRILRIGELFRGREGERIEFKESLTDANDPYDIVLSFTSVLEMVKGRYIIAEQEQLYGDIYLRQTEEAMYDNQEDN